MLLDYTDADSTRFSHSLKKMWVVSTYVKLDTMIGCSGWLLWGFYSDVSVFYICLQICWWLLTSQCQM